MLVCGLLTVTAAPSAAQVPDPARARRVADIVSIALAEYREGVSNGRVVALEELEEARLFLHEARRAAAAFPADVGKPVLERVDALLAGVEALRPASELALEVERMRSELEAAVGVPLDPLPSGPPSLSQGAGLYRRYCESCHGKGGAGDGPQGSGLDPPVADLSDGSALRSVAPVEFFRRINVGVAGTAMPGFSATLDLDSRWAVALYAASLRFAAESRSRGGELMRSRCEGCDLLVSDFSRTALLSDDSLASLLARRTGLERSSSEFADLVAYARVAAAVEELGGDRQLRAVRTVGRTKEGVREAIRSVERGDHEAAVRYALDAYLVFEGIESAVRARDGAAARRVERTFAEFRGALAAPVGSERWNSAAYEVEAALDAVVELLTARPSTPVLFGQAFVIMLREGLEAILIVGALVAVLVKAGASERRREIGQGVVVAIGASLVTAAGFATLFRSAAASQEILEGATMLLAAAVLFWVSYWLVSKVESRAWTTFVRSRVDRALSGGGFALGAVAFLAVYREGFETVLFYAALFAGTDGAPVAVGGVLGGIAAGVGVLLIVYFTVQHYGVRIPLKPFFTATSGLLYLMAFSFAGQGVAELQSAGVIGVTPVEWLPAVPFLGVFPTVQTALSQLVLATALVGALLWVFAVQPARSRNA